MGLKHRKGEDLEEVLGGHSHYEGSKPQCAGGGWRSPEAPAENASDGSCEASPGRSEQRPRCSEAQGSAQAQGVALAHSGRPRTPAHRQSAQTPNAAGHCRYKGQRRSGHSREAPPHNVVVFSCWAVGPSSWAPTGLGSHLIFRLRSIRGVPTPQGLSGPPARPSSTCSRGEHVLSTTSVLVTSRPRISTVLGGLPSASGTGSGPSSSQSSSHGAREQWDGAARGPGLLGSSRELRLGEGLWGPCWVPPLLALSARCRRCSRGLASSPSCC